VNKGFSDLRVRDECAEALLSMVTTLEVRDWVSHKRYSEQSKAELTAAAAAAVASEEMMIAFNCRETCSHVLTELLDRIEVESWGKLREDVSRIEHVVESSHMHEVEEAARRECSDVLTLALATVEVTAWNELRSNLATYTELVKASMTQSKVMMVMMQQSMKDEVAAAVTAAVAATAVTAATAAAATTAADGDDDDAKVEDGNEDKSIASDSSDLLIVKVDREEVEQENVENIIISDNSEKITVTVSGGKEDSENKVAVAMEEFEELEIDEKENSENIIIEEHSEINVMYEGSQLEASLAEESPRNVRREIPSCVSVSVEAKPETADADTMTEPRFRREMSSSFPTLMRSSSMRDVSVRNASVSEAEENVPGTTEGASNAPSIVAAAAAAVAALSEEGSPIMEGAPNSDSNVEVAAVVASRSPEDVAMIDHLEDEVFEMKQELRKLYEERENVESEKLFLQQQVDNLIMTKRTDVVKKYLEDIESLTRVRGEQSEEILTLKSEKMKLETRLTELSDRATTAEKELKDRDAIELKKLSTTEEKAQLKSTINKQRADLIMKVTHSHTLTLTHSLRHSGTYLLTHSLSSLQSLNQSIALTR